MYFPIQFVSSMKINSWFTMEINKGYNIYPTYLLDTEFVL